MVTVQYYSPEDGYTAFENYVLEGGIAGSYLYTDTEARYSYISDVFNTLIVRDIRQKYKIRNPQLMDMPADYMMDNFSNLTSVRNIANTLNHNSDKKTARPLELIFSTSATLLHSTQYLDMILREKTTLRQVTSIISATMCSAMQSWVKKWISKA